MGTQGIMVGMQEIRVRMQGIGVGMLVMWRIRMGM